MSYLLRLSHEQGLSHLSIHFLNLFNKPLPGIYSVRQCWGSFRHENRSAHLQHPKSGKHCENVPGIPPIMGTHSSPDARESRLWPQSCAGLGWITSVSSQRIQSPLYRVN